MTMCWRSSTRPCSTGASRFCMERHRIAIPRSSCCQRNSWKGVFRAIALPKTDTQQLALPDARAGILRQDGAGLAPGERRAHVAEQVGIVVRAEVVPFAFGIAPAGL